MSISLDASVLVALFTADALTAKADAFLREHRPTVIVSNSAAAELASAVARRVRTANSKPTMRARRSPPWRRTPGRCGPRTGENIVLPTWRQRARSCAADLHLRTPDALHIAIAQRLAAELMTFDQKMAASAPVAGHGRGPELAAAVSERGCARPPRPIAIARLPLRMRPAGSFYGQPEGRQSIGIGGGVRRRPGGRWCGGRGLESTAPRSRRCSAA